MRILFVARTFPYPLNDGGRIRVYQMLRALASRHEVTFAGLQDDDDHVFAEAVQELSGYCFGVVRLGRRVRPSGASKCGWRGWWQEGLARAVLSPLPELLRGAEHEVVSTLRKIVSETAFDAIHFAGFGTLRYMSAFRCDRDTYSSLDLSDVESIKAKRQLQVLPATRILSEWRLREHIDWFKLAYSERRLLKRFDLCLVCSEHDDRLLQQRQLARRTFVFPNGVDTTYFHWETQGKEIEGRIIFFGSMSYEPNVDGIHFFCREIFPAVKQEIAAAHLYIVGKEPHASVQSLHNGQDIFVTGTVNDIRHHIQESAVAVVPLRVGGGTRLKILEAMAMGKAVVSTAVGCEGITVTHGENIFINDDPGEFAHTCAKILRDLTLRRRLGDAARKLVRESYDWRKIRDQLANCYGTRQVTK